jgi:CRISPR-associated protein Cas1
VTLKDLRALPKVRDSWSYLYVEHCRVDQEARAIALHDVNGKIPVPVAALTLLMLGPGTSVTHAAVRVLAESGCLVAWTGEQGVRFYAQGLGETRSSRSLQHQALLCSSPRLRMQVVRRMYRMRFDEELDDSLTLEQIRGREGIRVREAYAAASRQTGVEWRGRNYDRREWGKADAINRALSVASSCVYGVCHAAIVSAGYSPALGFIHTGHMLSFVYDIADLYRVEIIIPAAFAAVAESAGEVDRRVRYACREAFYHDKILDRIVPDIRLALGQTRGADVDEADFDTDDRLIGGLWDPVGGHTRAGVNHEDIAG